MPLRLPLRTALVFLSLLVAAPVSAQDANEGERLNAFFEEVHQAAVARWPEWQAWLGLKTNYDKWNDRSEAKSLAEHEITVRNLARLRTEFDFDKLEPRDRISYRLFERDAELSVEYFPFRHHYYPVNHRGGPHKDLPAFLINTHKIDTLADAQAYVARLRGIPEVMAQTIRRQEIHADKGIIAPRFVFPLVLADIEGVMTGVPFDKSGKDSTFLSDFRKKIAALNLPDSEREALIEEATLALVEAVKPAYRALADAMKALEPRATTDHGVWKFPDGDAYYALRLRSKTTTNLTAEEVHDYGLAEVERIHDEMRQIMKRLKFRGTLREFFKHVRKSSANYYPNTDEGRAAYLSDAKGLLERMEAKLDGFFNLRPKAALEVRRVEPFRERTSSGGFYNSPSVYGDRPGVYYVNLRDMRQAPKSGMEGLAYHEGLPGHHMQIAIAQELENLPKFRRFGGYTAYGEGWALYAERLGKEMGFYQDPMSDYGRLAWELLRAARLVVDTGLHYKRWTRDEAIAYLDANISSSHKSHATAIERYIVWPAQATAYKIGMRQIMELRSRAKQRLGADFDIRAYHDVVLKDGAVPLDILEELVEDWVSQNGG